MSDIEIEINGQKLSAKSNQTVIQVADAAGIYIPRFCYHSHLSIAANCRMCLVEVEKSPKPLPACATPVTPGMKVLTQSQKALEAQRSVMEFLLINHPLDCPICDQGGECELQDLSMGYGASASHYDEAKRAVADENLGPLISTEMTRCIYCTRCVRFGDEIAGLREMGVIGRGEHTEVGTYIQHTVKSEVSGNIIDLCPVGALTAKPSRFTARAWELTQLPSVSPHDCFGSNLYIHTRDDNVMRVVARENLAINEMWIADRDRFSYTGLHHADRLVEPLVRTNGTWQAVAWEEAFNVAAAGLQAMIAEHGADKLGALASPNSTVEEFYLLQKIMRGLDCPHIDHRLREVDTQDQVALGLFPGLAMPIAALQECDAILLVGSNLQKEQPLAALRVRKASHNGAVVLVINPVDYEFNFSVNAKKIIAPHQLPAALAEIIAALKAPSSTNNVAQQLGGKKKIGILLGALALHHPQAALVRGLAQQIAQLSDAKIGLMTDGANTAGGWLAGAVPHRLAGGTLINHPGLSAYEMLAKPRKGYVLFNIEPEFDCANAKLAMDAMQQAKFVIAFSAYRNPALLAHADVIFPIVPFTETAGTFVNVTGEWQRFNGVAKAVGSSRPGWKVLRVLGNFLHLDGFDYEDVQAVQEEVSALYRYAAPQIGWENNDSNYHYSEQRKELLSRIGEIPIYAGDSLVRRAKPLQEIQLVMEGDVAVVKLHPETAVKLKLQDGERVRVRQASGEAKLSVKIDAHVAVDAVWVAGGISATEGLGDLFGEVEVEKVC